MKFPTPEEYYYSLAQTEFSPEVIMKMEADHYRNMLHQEDAKLFELAEIFAAKSGKITPEDAFFILHSMKVLESDEDGSPVVNQFLTAIKLSNADYIGTHKESYRRAAQKNVAVYVETERKRLSDLDRDMKYQSAVRRSAEREGIQLRDEVTEFILKFLGNPTCKSTRLTDDDLKWQAHLLATHGKQFEIVKQGLFNRIYRFKDPLEVKKWLDHVQTLRHYKLCDFIDRGRARSDIHYHMNLGIKEFGSTY